MKRPVVWIGLVLVSFAAAGVAWRAFPEAFSIIALDISMDRNEALASARTIAARDGLGPAGYREAASFELDDETQTFVELEGGGKAAFTAMIRDGLYSAYTWRVRHFRESEANETTLAFTPDGKPEGFVEKIREDAPGAALDAATARAIAERDAAARWGVILSPYVLAEQGQERRSSGRVDHTFTYERPSPVLNEGQYRLRLVVSGDRLTEVTPFVKVPEAFTRRYENMRSANTAIGTGSVAAMIVLYGVGGIGIGLFLMLRRRWVLWTQAVWWGALVAALQMLASVNEWPLMWMSYDTAVPRLVFFGQQIAALVAGFFGFTALYGLSFIAAETLTRRAFGTHPQFWRVWGRGPGSSTAILGRTAGGYLLVSVFFAYDVVLYLVATRRFGWWAPSEALVQPDVLATYVPWFSAIANSMQAGFWEECMFRAIPLAGAALIGDRFGKRRLFLVIGFVVQAIVFGSGHAPYENQPAYARPVELILPSIGFGLLYVNFGLLPGIILHFVFDTVWFALPIFVAHSPGIWLQRVMVVLVVFMPLWIVIWRRAQAGRWTALEEADRNAAWTPPAPTERAADPEVVAERTLGSTARSVWLVLGAAALAACALMAGVRRGQAADGLHVSRDEAIAIARAALDQRGAVLPPGARFLATVDDGSGSPNEFVSETAGEATRHALLGVYLGKPRWMVRVATFEGDVAKRAEEWRLFVGDSRQAWPIQHALPEDRPGASLDEAAARRIALQALAQRSHLDPARGDIREVKAAPDKLKARTDWTFTFVDQTVPKLPQGEPWIAVDLSGDEVTSIGRFIHVPEEWQRTADATDTRNSMLQYIDAVVPSGLLVAVAVLGLIAWSRRRYTPGLFFAAAATMLAASIVGLANQWPSLMASLSTAQPLQLQLGTIVAVSFIALALSAVFIALPVGALPTRMSRLAGSLPERDALWLGVAAGAIGAAALAAAGWLRTPVWDTTPDLSPMNGASTILTMIVGPVTGFFGRLALMATLLAMLDRPGRGRAVEFAAMFAVGFASVGGPVGSSLPGWIEASCLAGAVVAVVSIALVAIDLTMLPVALATAMIVSQLMRAAASAFPGAVAGSLCAAVVAGALGWWWFKALRRSRVPMPAAA